MGDLACAAKHLTPALFGAEVAKLARPVPVVAVHIKAHFRPQILDELMALGLPNLVIGELGVECEW